MEYLIKQRRVTFSEVGQDSKKETESISGGGRIPSHKGESFQGDKRGKNWNQRQFSTQMSPDYDSSFESEFATAIAAAAFAIHSVDQEANSEYHKRLRDGTQTSMISRVNTRKEDLPESSRVSRWLSVKESKDAAEASMRKRMEQESRASHPSFAGRVGRDESQTGKTTRRRSQEAKADAWEKSAMAKIKKRYDKMSSSILAWENEKKMKAKVEMERKKRELEMRRALHQQHYQNKIGRIDHVAGGARVQIEEKRRNEESEVKERAKRIRSTGKVPFSCFCF